MDDRGRRRWPRAQRLLQMLHFHSDTFARIPFRGLEEVGETAVVITSSTLNCRLSALLLNGEDQESTLFAGRGIPPEARGAWHADEPLLRHLWSGLEAPTIFRADALESALQRSAERLGLGETFLAAPLKAIGLDHREERIGVLIAAELRDESELEADLMALDLIASLVTGGITSAASRIRLLETAKALEREVEERREAEVRLRFLSEASSALAASLDYQETLKSVARLAVSGMADFCLIDTRDEDTEEIHRVAVAHRDPAKEKLLRYAERFPPGPGSPLGEVFSTGEPRLVTEVTQEWMEATARSPEHLEFIRTLGPRSSIVVPLIARDHTLGVFTLGSTERKYDADDLALAEELARRAALAADNARLYKRALVANQAKSDFLAVMSHELRTPLNAVLGYADLLEFEIAGPLTEKQRKEISRIKVSARQLMELIEEILTFSRLETGKEEARQERVDLSALLSEVAARFGPLAQEKGLRFQVSAPEEPAVVEIDQAKVRQILYNLLSNAVKFTEKGEVELRARLEDEVLLLQVRDTGIGIAPAYRERIFNAFWQVEQGRTRRAGGTGLGLSVTRRLVHLLGGEVSVESEPGKGSTFTVNLPVSPI